MGAEALTIFVDLVLSAVIGLAFAACARPQAREGIRSGREVAAVVSFAVAIRWPVAAYLLLVHGDWAWLYLVDPARLGRSGLVGALIADLVLVVGGWSTGWSLVKRGRDRALAYALGGGAALLLLILYVARARLGAYGSYREFHAGHTLPLGEVKLGWVLPALALGTAVGAVAVGWTLWSHGRRAGAARMPPAPAAAPDVTPASGEAAPSGEGQPSGSVPEISQS